MGISLIPKFMNPRVSVIIPYYEGKSRLPGAAASVLGQTGVELELIIVDDGSVSPAETEFLKDERVRLIRMGHAGKGAAVNRGTAAARGEIICVLDQDDLMAEGRLARQAAALDAGPETAAVYSDYERVGENGERMDIFFSRQASNREMLHAMASGVSLISMLAMAVRKRVLERLGGFSEDPALTGLDDGEFFVRLICSGERLLYVPGIAGQWVSHGGNYSKGAGFHDARLVFLSKLLALCSRYPMLQPEMKYFRAHAHAMRGIFFLEKGDYAGASEEFSAQVKSFPFGLNAYYLLAKAFLCGLIVKKGGRL